MTGFPCVIAQRDEPAQPLNVQVVQRPRLEVDQVSFKRRPRGRPILSAVVQQPLRMENHSVYDLGNPDHGASHVFSPARVPRMRRKRGAVDVKRIRFDSGVGAVASAGTTTPSAAPI
jgi:hypothetical protein